MRQFFSDLWAKYRSEIGIAMGIVALYLFFFAVGITCPIKFITGISCPGCGMSRAFLNAIKGNFGGAFYYHPMWIAVPIIAFLLVLFKIKKNVTAFNVTVGVFAVLMLGVYVYRLFFLPQSVVVFSPSDSVFVRVYSFVRGLFNFE